MQLDPYEEEPYRQIWIACGDPNGELEKLSDAFDTGLGRFISEYINDFAMKNDERFCSGYNSSGNPERASVLYEGKIKEALESLVRFCDDHDVEYSKVSYYKKYLDVLKMADTVKRTVDGVVYDTVEIADGVRRDTKLFYESFKGLDITDEGLVRQAIFACEFTPEVFKKTLTSRIEKEIMLRRPEMLFDNLKNTVSCSKYANRYQKEFEIERFNDSIRQKRGMFYYFCGFTANEIALVLLDRSVGLMGRGSGKSGFLITNKNIHIYKNAGLTTTKVTFDLYDVERIECLGPDSYAMMLKNGSNANNDYRFGLELELKLNIYQENELARLLTEIVRICQNVNRSKMALLTNVEKEKTDTHFERICR